MDEQTINNQQVTPTATPAASAAPATAAQPTTQQNTPLQSGIQAQPAENLPAGVSDYSAQIQQMYDAQLAAKQQSMEDAYNQNLVTMQRAKEQVAPTYFNQGNDLATQYERTRRNNNLQADANGLNTGAGSQMALAQQSNFLDAFGRVRAAQANAERQADQQIADLEVAYKSQVAQALADNDYQKATALLAEYQRRDNAAEEMRRYNYQQQLADAKQRAAYGDFGGFSDLYGADTAKNMQQFWAFNNPDYALAMGMITPDQYQQATGYYPGSSGYSGSSGGGYYRSGGGGYRSSGSGGSGGSNGIEGTGPYVEPTTPAVEPVSSEVGDSDRFDAAYYEYLDVLGSEQRAYERMMKDRENAARATVGQSAVAAGLTPGSNAYNKYVDDRLGDVLSSDQWYVAAQDGYNEYSAQADARRQARENEAKTQQFLSAAAQGLNPQSSASNAEISFWQNVFNGGSNSANTSNGNSGGASTAKNTTTQKMASGSAKTTKAAATKKNVTAK